MKALVIIYTLIITFFSASLFAQNDSLQVKEKDFARNTVFFELLGNGGLYSFNYDWIIVKEKKHLISLRGGVSMRARGHNGTYYVDPMGIPNVYKNYIGDELFNNSLILPIEINYMIGKKHYFEIGCGLTGDIHLVDNLYGSRLYLFTRILGFRYQKEDGGFFFRTGLVPSFKIFYYKNEFFFDPWRYYFSYISFDFGYTF